MGGLAFSTSMVWTQAFPFVAQQYFDDEGATSKEIILTVLIGSSCLWLLLNIVFLCTIDLSYLNTFIGTKTGPQYTCELYNTATDDSLRWDAAFTNRKSFTKKIDEEIKKWVTANVVRWQQEKPEWFKIEMIPDDFLPMEVLAAEGGAARKSSVVVSVRELVGINENGSGNDNRSSRRVSPAT